MSKSNDSSKLGRATLEDHGTLADSELDAVSGGVIKAMGNLVAARPARSNSKDRFREVFASIRESAVDPGRIRKSRRARTGGPTCRPIPEHASERGAAATPQSPERSIASPTSRATPSWSHAASAIGKPPSVAPS